MMSRVSSSAGARTMLNNMQLRGQALQLAQEQLTTGKRINRVSDSPADAVTALGQRAVLRRAEQFTRNADESASWLSSADTALTTVNDNLTSARSLLIQANSASTDATSRAAIAANIRSLRTSLLQTANTIRDGRPLFGGTTNAGVPYDTSGVYQGNQGTIAIPVSDGISIQVNRPGPEVFGNHNASDPANGDVFQLLESLATAVENGSAVDIGAGITKIDAATTRAALAQVAVGASARQLEDVTARLEDSKLVLTTGISRVEDIDLAESVLRMKTQEAAYQAALQATAKVIQPSLLDFLR